MARFFATRLVVLAMLLSITGMVMSTENIHWVGKKQARYQQATINSLLNRAEHTVDIDLEQLAEILLLIARNPLPLDKLQRHRLMLLQANRLILETDFSNADDILGELLQLKPSVEIIMKSIYCRAYIADKLEDYERAFLYLNRLEQYPKPSFSIEQQFKILSLATTLYTKAHAVNYALGFARQALSLAQRSTSHRLLCYANKAKSDVLLMSKDITELKLSALAAIDACQIANENIALAGSYIDLSIWQGQQQEHVKQRVLIEQAIELLQRQDLVISLNSENLLLAEALLLENNILAADNILNKIFNQVEQSKILTDLVLGYRIKAMLFEKLGLPDDAMVYFKKYIKVQNSSNDRVRKIHVAYLQSRFDNKIDQQSAVIAQIEQQNLGLLAKASMLTNLILLSTALLFLSISFYCFTFYRRRRSVTLTGLSNRDDLTQLFNPEYGNNLAQNMLTQSGRDRTFFGVICIDLDFMSAVNNSFSYDFGDILIQSFAGNINEIINDTGIVIRHSGDYFIAFIPGLGPVQQEDLVVKIHQCLDGLAIDRQNIIVSCSIGWNCQAVDVIEDVNLYLSLMVEQASQALRQAKFNGRNQWIRYEHGKIDESLAEADYKASSF